jgi:hypothetical protein
MPFATQAALINIVLSEVDVIYDGETQGGVIYDKTALPGGGVPPGFGPFNDMLADQVRTAVFSLDGSTVGTKVFEPGYEMFGDLKISGIGPTITLNTLYTTGNNGGGFGFDWFSETAPNTLGDFLQLGMDEVDISLNRIGGVNIALSFSGLATLRGQSLPFGLAFDPTKPIVFTYSAPFPITGGSPNPDSAMGRGAMVITGTAIPEPATCILLCAGLAAIGFAALRRQRPFVRS